MDQKQLQQKIAEYYGKLPENLQRFFADMNWLNTLQEINTKYGLNDGQIETLSTETMLILLGIVPTEDYVKILEQNLKIPNEKTDEFFSELNEKIFKDIGYDLEETFIKNANELAEEKHTVDNKLDERFNNLPQELQNAIARSDWKNKLYGIAQNHKLNVEQMGILEDVTAQVILNTVHGDQYENTLIGKLNISGEEAGKIAGEVNESILKSIREIEMSSKKQVVSSTEQVVGSKENANTATKTEGEIPLPPYVDASSKKNVVSGKEKINSMEQVVGSKENANTENKPINPLEEKLMRPTISTQNIPNNSAPKVDPYREQF